MRKTRMTAGVATEVTTGVAATGVTAGARAARVAAVRVVTGVTAARVTAAAAAAVVPLTVALLAGCGSGTVTAAAGSGTTSGTTASSGSTGLTGSSASAGSVGLAGLPRPARSPGAARSTGAAAAGGGADGATGAGAGAGAGAAGGAGAGSAVGAAAASGEGQPPGTGGTRCHTADLSLQVIQGPQQAEGSSGDFYVQLTNKSSHTCTLYGFPGVDLLALQGTGVGGSLGMKDVWTTGLAMTGGKHIQTLTPGEAGAAHVTFGTRPPGGTAGFPRAAEVSVIPPDETIALTAPIDNIYEGPVDLLATSQTLTVGPMDVDGVPHR